MSRTSARNKKLHEEVLASFCDVCFTQFRKVPAKKINQGLEILVCTKCSTKVHKCCYDLDAADTAVNDKIREFVCQKCSEPKSPSKQCFVCHHSDGALILTEDQDWVHVFCALYHNQIEILAYTPKIKAQKSTFYQATNKICDQCKLPNAFENCAFQGCLKVAHPYCARKAYATEELQNDEPKCWNHHLSCGASNLFDLKNQPIPFGLLKETVDQKLSEVTESAPFQIPNKDTILQKIYDEYIQDIKKQKKQSKNVKRGGYSFVSCPQHESTLHCICQGTGEGSEMVECETCMTWYHVDCIKCKLPAHDEIFVCMFCKSFYELKKKIIDEVIGGKNDNFEIRCELPAKMSFMDVMWIIRGIDSRISKGNMKIVKELAKYPLRSSKMDKIIKNQNKKTLENLCEQFFHEFFFSESQLKHFKPHAVLGLDSNNKPVRLDENIQKNKKLRQFIITLQDFCNQNEIVHEFKSIELELEWKEEAVSDSYEKIIELSKSQQKYQEVHILKIKAQAYSFLQIVKKVNSGTIITFNQLQQSVRKASLIQNVPQYLTQPLTQKYQKVKSIIKQLQSLIQSDPYNLNQIKITANKLTTDFKIQPPIGYDLYLEERNFVNTLYFYYLKLNESKIQAELTLKQKLAELVDNTALESFVCNQELTKNLNIFLELRNKANNPKYAFEQLKTIIANLEKKTVKHTLLNLQSNTTIKKQKLQYLFQKIRQYDIQDPQISSLVQKYQEILKTLNEILDKPLQTITSVNILRIMNDSCAQLMNQLEKFPLKVEQETKNHKSLPWLHIVRNKKQEIHQLLTLAQEAQLQKNPLSISKLTETIPKENPLVKAYKELKKEHHEINSQFVNLLALCSQKIEYLRGDGAKKTRKEQIEINEKKPDLKRFNEVLEMLNHSKVDFSKEVKDLTKIINKSLDFSYAVQKFAKSKQTFENVNNVEELANARKQIDELRKKVLLSCEMSLTKELTQLYHCEIHNRIRSNYLSGNFDLDKNSKLLKFAEEEGINKTSTYFKLKEKFDSKNQKSKEINLIKNIEVKLKEQASKETDPLYKNLYALRKELKVPDVDQETPKISYIEELKQKNKEIKAKIAKIQSAATNPETKITLDEAKIVLFEALKSPFNLNSLHQFYLDVERCHSFYTNWKRSHNLGRNTLYNDDKLREYEKLKFRVDELQTASKEIYKLKSSMKILETIENIQDESLEAGLNQNLYENLTLIEQNLETIQENIIAGEDTEMIVLGKKKYLKIWANCIKGLKREYSNVQRSQTTNDTSIVLVNAKKIKKLLYDSYYLLQNELKSTTISALNSQDNINELKESIIFLEQFFLEIKFNYLEGQYDKRTNIMDSWIDLDDIMYDLKVGGTLEEIFFVYKPFDDLSKFKFKNISNKNSDLLLTSKPSTKQETTGKRTRPEDMEAKEERPLIKKVSSQYTPKEEESDQEQKQNQNVVTANSRKKVKDILSKNILKNIELKKVGTCENEIKMIENQIFGEYHDDVVKYFETSEKFEKLFIKLQSCPQISKKMIKKEFQFKFIKLLVENLNTISDIESMMVNKLNEEKSAEKYSSMQSVSLDISASSKIEEEHNVLEMLATGKVNEEYKKDLADEMKKIKEGKDKKKKKSKHKNRSRSRSASPAAKFSSDQEQENLPTYIQKQYAQDASKRPAEAKSPHESIPIFAKVQHPLMFDPEINQQEMEDIEKKYPRGSTLKIKSANLQFFLKKKGKMQMKVNLYSTEDYKKILSELVDPGFTALNIRKEKTDKEILQYLNKPSKKKYRFLVCWVEAETPELNENLKELSEQANERHKIYGWQNELIKIHVMSIKQFVQLTRFASTTPSKTIFKNCVQMFDTERIICLIQYPAQKMFELKEKFKNFSEIQRIDQTYDVSVPLPTYDTYEPMESISQPFYPAMQDVQAPNLSSIKSLGMDDVMAKESKPVEFQGWGSASEPDTPVFGRTSSNPYEDTRARLGFGRFSPINTDQEDNVPSSRESLPDPTDSILKSLEKKDSFSSIPTVMEPVSFKPERPFIPEPYEQQPPQPMPYGQKFDRPYHHNQNKFYGDMGGNNPMHQGGMNPMRGGYNNPMGGGFNQHHNNRGFNSHHGQNNFGQNKFQNRGNDFRPNYGNQFNQNRNMPYQRQNRNPMFNPMNNPMNPMQNNQMGSMGGNPMGGNPMGNNPMVGNNPMTGNNPIGGNNPISNNPMGTGNPMYGNNPISANQGNNNQGGYGQQNQYQHGNNQRYQGYQQHGNNHGGYPQ